VGIALNHHIVAPGFTYQVHPDHRNGTQSKSQWTISQTEELGVFGAAVARRWLLQNRGWGLYIQNDQFTVVGVSADQARRIFVAKFTASNAPQIWHGYPADHQIHSHDIPAPEIMKRWMDTNVLAPRKIRKLSKGQPCNL
jgi:hypothetical protein